MNMVKEKKFISVVTYIHNDENYLSKYLDLICDAFKNNFENYELIFVNDASTDSSVDVIKRYFKDNDSTEVSIINMSFYHGAELSMVAGVDLAIGDYVFEFDSVEIDYDENVIIKVYNEIINGYDLVSAVPNKKMSFLSELFYNLMKKYGNYEYNMVSDRFRVITRRLINRIGDYNKTIFYRKALYESSGLSTNKILYSIIPSHNCKVNNKYKVGLAIDSLIIFTNIGFVISCFMTFVMMILMAVVSIYALVFKIFNKPVAGWTFTTIFLSLCFFGLFSILTIVVKYLQLIIDLQVRRKKYSFNSIEKVS